MAKAFTIVGGVCFIAGAFVGKALQATGIMGLFLLSVVAAGVVMALVGAGTAIVVRRVGMSTQDFEEK